MKRNEANNNISKLADYIEEDESGNEQDHLVNQMIATGVRTVGGILVGMWKELARIADNLEEEK